MTLRTWQRVKYSVDRETHVFYVDVADDSEAEQMKFRGAVYRTGETWAWTIPGDDAFPVVAGLTEGKAAVEQASGGSKYDPVRARILASAEDLMVDFLYYGRKEDEGLPVGAIDKALASEVVTVDELLEIFRKALESARKEPLNVE